LQQIAAKYATILAVLLKMNKMKLKDTLYAGRKLEAPLSEEAQDSGSETKKTVKPLKAKSEVIVHKVKKGETLDRIAREYQTSVAALLKLNHMKIYDPLYAGQNLDIALKIP
jgi:N-acetylmuramoyl-L-alanine amidase